jgi:chromodomain-helicase-DNA-binding protein 4
VFHLRRRPKRLKLRECCLSLSCLIHLSLSNISPPLTPQITSHMPCSHIHLRSQLAAPPNFRRAHVPQAQLPSPGDTPATTATSLPNQSTSTADDYIRCVACKTTHLLGSCPLKVAGVEYCNLCGIAHYGHARVCPHITSETQVCF